MSDLVIPQRGCLSCKYFVPPNGPGMGECHRMPPFLTVFLGPPEPSNPTRPSTFNIVSFPQVNETMWCGEHKPRILNG